MGVKSGTITVDNQASTSTGTSPGSDNGNAIIGVSVTVVASRLVTAPATTDLGNLHFGATVSTAAGSYNLAAGSGGSITFKNGGGNATLTNSAGSHTVSAPVVLASNLDVSTAPRPC